MNIALSAAQNAAAIAKASGIATLLDMRVERRAYIKLRSALQRIPAAAEAAACGDQSAAFAQTIRSTSER
jgi:hypothetical protein